MSNWKLHMCFHPRHILPSKTSFLYATLLLCYLNMIFFYPCELLQKYCFLCSKSSSSCPTPGQPLDAQLGPCRDVGPWWTDLLLPLRQCHCQWPPESMKKHRDFHHTSSNVPMASTTCPKLSSMCFTLHIQVTRLWPTPESHSMKPCCGRSWSWGRCSRTGVGYPQKVLWRRGTERLSEQLCMCKNVQGEGVKKADWVAIF